MTRYWMMLAALCGLLATSGCSSPLVFPEDTEWPTKAAVQKMGVEAVEVSSRADKTPWFSPICHRSSIRFVHEAEIGRIEKGPNGRPKITPKPGRFALVLHMRDKPVWRSVGEPDDVWTEVFTGPANAGELLKRGSMSADQFGWSVLEQSTPDGTWRAVERNDATRRRYSIGGVLIASP